MSRELKFLLKTVSKGTMILSSVLAIGAALVFSKIHGIALFAGAFLSLLGFILSSVVLNKTLNRGGGAILNILTTLLKSLVIAGVGAFFFIKGLGYGISYLLGFLLLFPGLFYYSGKNK